MRKILLSIALIVCFCASVLAADKYRFATGGATGTYYAYGTVLGGLIQEKTKKSVTVQTTGASKANVLLVNEGEVELAVSQNDVLSYAYRGTNLFKGQKLTGFQVVATLYPEVCQIVVRGDAGIKSVADLKGKRVSVGDAGSGTEFNAEQILGAYGVKFADIKKQNLGVGPSADAIKDNKLDAFFFSAGVPTPAITDLMTSNNVTILNIDDAHAKALIKSYPFYTQFSVPQGTYKGLSSPVKTVAIQATLFVSPKLSVDEVYAITKAIFDNKAVIAKAHAKGAELNINTAKQGLDVPFHPGAEKYFKEKGIK
ncbi:TAXI family TRAP transporter solute-binding subunit [Deferribacterales bacterium RsTz2092]|nr:C4-dicarboxylate ABC transporter substrate-binding protein [Deferribacterales bacterium]